MATALLLFLPLGRVYIQNGLVHSLGWVLAVMTRLVCVVVTIVLSVLILKSRERINMSYPTGRGHDFGSSLVLLT